ncbi:MAG: chorismate synthase [Oscillospiraceae bacterium]|nr:chorismate synthase [Oscillospiraceae bacterium]
MKNTLGNVLTVTLFGESHGAAIGAVIDGIAAGIPVSEEFICEQLSKRRPKGNISTPRREADSFKILSGVFEGKTTGTPIAVMIENGDTHSSDYGEMKNKMRPSHADYTAQVKYGGNQDFRGGGHFSGRITAAIVAAGALIIPALNKKGIFIGTHIKNIAGVEDRSFEGVEDLKNLEGKDFAVLNDDIKALMTDKIEAARKDGNSVGGILETAVYGMPAGIGEPWFDTLEGELSKALFSIPAVKGVQFGLGFGFANTTGADANDQMQIENGKVVTFTNNNGGILGGISNGMPIVFGTVIKPTPTISREQKTVDISTMSDTLLAARGRHDPCIVHRAAVVADSVTAIVLADMLSVKYGTDWLGE